MKSWVRYVILPSIFVLGFAIFIWISNMQKNLNGLYLVYACSKNCYTLTADVVYEDGSTIVDTLYFSNGGWVNLDCSIEGGFCYEINNMGLAKENGRDWDIKLIKRIGEERNRGQ